MKEIELLAGTSIDYAAVRLIVDMYLRVLHGGETEYFNFNGVNIMVFPNRGEKQ